MGAYRTPYDPRTGTFTVYCDERGCEDFVDWDLWPGEVAEAEALHDSWHAGLGEELTVPPSVEEYEHAPFETCSACNGSGRRWYGQCRGCQGAGVIPVEYT